MKIASDTMKERTGIGRHLDEALVYIQTTMNQQGNRPDIETGATMAEQVEVDHQIKVILFQKDALAIGLRIKMMVEIVVKMQ